MELRLDRALHRLDAGDVSLSDFAIDGRDSLSLSDAKNLGQGALLARIQKGDSLKLVVDPEAQKVNRTLNIAPKCKCAFLVSDPMHPSMIPCNVV